MILQKSFFARDCLTVAQELLGCEIVRRFPDGSVKKLRITETEAYIGESDTACHAHHGRTKRTEIMYRDAGTLYIYLCYGIHWMLNIVTGDVNDPQAVLIRACDSAPGPARLTKALGINGEFNGKNICNTDDLFFNRFVYVPEYIQLPRVGIGYASQEDQLKPWRFVIK